MHPTTREKLTRRDCLALDDHVRQYCKSTGKVAEAFDLLSKSSVKQSEQMRREATVLFQRLFVFRTKRQEKARSRNQGFVVVDHDEDGFEQHFYRPALDLDRDFPELFPVLGAANTVASTTERVSRIKKPTPRGKAQAAGGVNREIQSLLSAVQLSEDEDEPEVELFQPVTALKAVVVPQDEIVEDVYEIFVEESEQERELRADQERLVRVEEEKKWREQLAEAKTMKLKPGGNNKKTKPKVEVLVSALQEPEPQLQQQQWPAEQEKEEKPIAHAAAPVVEKKIKLRKKLISIQPKPVSIRASAAIMNDDDVTRRGPCMAPVLLASIAIGLSVVIAVVFASS